MCGNYITSFYYRISNNIPVNGCSQFAGEPPHCSKCKHPLKFYEFLPILSMISTKFSMKCNYCKAPINKVYIALECAVASAFVLNYLVLDMEQIFVLVSLYATSMILLISLMYEKKGIPLYITLFICFLGVIYRTIVDGSFYPWLMQILLYAMLLAFKQRDKGEFNFFHPRYIAIIWACCWLTPYCLALFMLLYMMANFFKMPPMYVFCLNFIFIYSVVLAIGAS